MSIPVSSESASSNLLKYSLTVPRDHGAIAPSFRVAAGSGTTSSSSTARVTPNPEQSGQAPNGELNEKERGSNSSKERPSRRQARCSLKVSSRSGSFSGFSTKSKVTFP